MVAGSGESTGDSPIDLAFAEMVCEDDQLLAAEFEAIITDFWDGPGRPGAVLVRIDPNRSAALGPPLQDGHALALGTVVARRRARRQRSPPRHRARSGRITRTRQGGEALSATE